MYIDALVLFVLGTIAGSFLNALSFRHNTGKTMWGRSACTSCGVVLRGQDLVPIVSFVFLRGRCRACKSTISFQYPTVEIIAGILTVLVYGMGGDMVSLTLTFGFFMLLLFIAVYDLRHTIIPNQFVFAAGALALLGHVWSPAGFIIPDMSFVVAGIALAAPLFLIWLLSSGRVMGLGDSKLMFAIGIFLGFQSGAAAFLLSFWIGALVGVLLLLITRSHKVGSRVTMKSEVPFGPFLVLGAVLAYFGHVTISSIILFF